MFKRINITKIIKDHFKTLKRIDRTGISLSDAFLFFLLPVIISFLLVCYNISLKSQVSNLITAMAILAGFLFNLLAIIHTSLGKIKHNIKDKFDHEKSLKFIFANEIHSNISYNIIVALFLIIFFILFGFQNDSKSPEQFFARTLDFTCIFLLIHFILTLFMILNRIYILLDKEDN